MLPLMEWGREGQSLARLQATVDVARECDCHRRLRQRPLPVLDTLARRPDGTRRRRRAVRRDDARDDGLVGALRGPVPLAKALTAIDILCDGRLIAGDRPGIIRARLRGSRHALRRAVAALRRGRSDPAGPAARRPRPRRADATTRFRERRSPRARAEPKGSRCGSAAGARGAGLRRVARRGDGWLASAYNTSPERFAGARELLAGHLAEQGRDGERFAERAGDHVDLGHRGPPRGGPHARVTARADPEARRERVARRGLHGPAERCAELLSRDADAGCDRVLFWPLADEPRQIERLAADVRPLITTEKP